MLTPFQTIGFALFFGIFMLGATTIPSSENHFSAYLVQNGKQLPIDHHVVKAKKAPFQIVVDMSDKEGVFVNISFSKETYAKALKNVNADQLPGFSKVAIYENWNNPMNELLVSTTQPNFWFVETPAKSKFNSHQNINNRYLCIRKAECIYDLDLHQNMPIEKLKKPLYFSFIKFTAQGDNFRWKELMRHNFRIEWVD